MSSEGMAMTLELNKVTGQVEEMGQVLAEGALRRQKVLPALRALKSALTSDQERLEALARSPVGQEARCAVPTHESLNALFPAPEPPLRATVLAADGSEIRPDAHGVALYYLINIGSLVYRHGSGQAPAAASDPRMAHAVDEKGNLLAQERLNARRDVAEIEKLADLAEAERSNIPLVALLDSTLGLRAWSSAIPTAEQEALQATYQAQLDRLRSAGAALAGLISRSQQAGVVSLLDLGRREDPASPAAELSPFQGITDQALWGDLRPGERSAIFFQAGALPVYFFYLNTEPPDWLPVPGVETEPARIEVPEWVALSPEKVRWVHALVYDQCRINNGYPYALTRADELAIILNEEREALEAMIMQAMSRRRMPLPRVSFKAAQKRIARAPSRRHP
jgi:NurA domain